MPDMQEQGLSPQERLKQVEARPDDLEQLIDQGWDAISQDVDRINQESLHDVAASREWVAESDDPDIHAALTGEANAAAEEINKAKDVTRQEIQKTLSTGLPEGKVNTEAELNASIRKSEAPAVAPTETGLALSPEEPGSAPAESPHTATAEAHEAAPATAENPAVEETEQGLSPEKTKLNEVMLSLVSLVKEFQQANFEASDEMKSRLNKILAKAHPDRNIGVIGMDKLSMMAGRLKNIFAGVDKLQTARGVSYIDDLKSLQATLGLPELDLEVVATPRPAPTVVERPPTKPAPTLMEEPIAASAAETEQPEAGKENKEKEINELYQGIGAVARELRKQEGFTTDEMLAQFKDVSDKALDLERTSSGTDAFKKMGTAREHLFRIIYGLSDPGERLKALDAFFQENPDLEGEAEEEEAETAERPAASLPPRPEMPEFDDFEGMMQVESWAFAISPDQFHDFFVKKDGERYQLALKDMEDVMLTRQTLIDNLSKVAPINKAVGNKIRLQVEMLQSANEITEKRRAQWEKQKELHLGEERLTEVGAEVDKLHAERVELEGDVRRGKDLQVKINEFDHKNTELQQMIIYVEGLRKQVGDMDTDINNQLKRLQDSKVLLAQLEGKAKNAEAQAIAAEEAKKRGVEVGMVGDWAPHEGVGAAVEGAFTKTADTFVDLTTSPSKVVENVIDALDSVGKGSSKKPKKAA